MPQTSVIMTQTMKDRLVNRMLKNYGAVTCDVCELDDVDEDIAHGDASYAFVIEVI